MSRRLTISDIEKSKVANLNRHLVDQPKNGKKVKLPQADSKEKAWMKWQLWYFCLDRDIEWKEEHKFHKERKWRFDFAIPSLMIAIEYEGLMSKKSRHTTVTGFTGDADKYNAAQALGWRVLRFTALNYKNVIQELKKMIV